jgi:hypothetical protein
MSHEPVIRERTRKCRVRLPSCAIREGGRTAIVSSNVAKPSYCCESWRRSCVTSTARGCVRSSTTAMDAGRHTGSEGSDPVPVRCGSRMSIGGPLTEACGVRPQESCTTAVDGSTNHGALDGQTPYERLIAKTRADVSRGSGARITLDWLRSSNHTIPMACSLCTTASAVRIGPRMALSDALPESLARHLPRTAYLAGDGRRSGILGARICGSRGAAFPDLQDWINVERRSVRLLTQRWLTQHEVALGGDRPSPARRSRSLSSLSPSRC